MLPAEPAEGSSLDLLHRIITGVPARFSFGRVNRLRDVLFRIILPAKSPIRGIMEPANTIALCQLRYDWLLLALRAVFVA